MNKKQLLIHDTLISRYVGIYGGCGCHVDGDSDWKCYTHFKGAPLKVDLGCGNNKKPGYVGVDIVKEGTEADIEHDLLVFPWPFGDGEVEEFSSSHYFEHVPQGLRGKFMDEAWRCLKVGGMFEVITPYVWSARSVQDFTHMWPPIVGESFLYFDREWRERNGLCHGAYDLRCNFKMVKSSLVLSERGQGLGDEVTKFAKHGINVVDDLVTILERR